MATKKIKHAGMDRDTIEFILSVFQMVEDNGTSYSPTLSVGDFEVKDKDGTVIAWFEKRDDVWRVVIK